MRDYDDYEPIPGDEVRSSARVSSYPVGDAYRAYQVLQIGFILLPLIAGLDKFAHYLTNWNQYLSPQFAQFGNSLLNSVGLRSMDLMIIVGVIEIIAAAVVAIRPRIGGWLVAIWLWVIIANLLLQGNFYDIALRDFGLSLGAIALAILSPEHFTTRRRMRVV